jgi:hypothetical protein
LPPAAIACGSARTIAIKPATILAAQEPLIPTSVSPSVLWHLGYQFYSHDRALAQDGSLGVNGELARMTIPANERTAALMDLGQMNINAFSLFGSNEKLDSYRLLF